MAEPQTLGEVSVRVSADLTDLKAKLRGEALGEVRQFDSAASKAAQASAGAFNPTVVGAKAFSAALTAANGNLSQITPKLLGLANAQKAHAAATELSEQKTRQLSGGLEHLALAAATGEASFAGMSHAALSMVHALGEEGGGLGGALRTVGSTVKNLVTNPIVLAVGAFAAATAAVHYFYEKFSLAGRAEEALKDHEKAIKGIAEAWKRASDGSAEYQAQAKTAVQFTARQDLIQQQKLLQDQLAGSRDQLAGFARVPIGADNNTNRLREFQPALRAFVAEAARGTPDVEKLNAEIQRIANLDPQDRALQKTAQGLLAVTKGAAETADRIRELNHTLNELRINQGFEAAGNQPPVLGTGAQARQLQAELLSIRARSPRELGAAAAARERATPFSQNESLDQRNFRIAAEAAKERARAELQLKDAMDQRVAAMNRSLAAGQLDLSLIGKTTAEITTQRMNFQLLSAAQEAAARSHTKVSEAEIAQIHAVAEAYGQVQENIAAAQEMSDLLFERANASRTAVERAVQSSLHGMGIDPSSDTGRLLAPQIRFNEELNVTISRMDDIRQGSANALTKFVEDLRQSATFGEALRNLLGNIADQLIRVGSSQIIKGLLGEQGQAGGGMFGGIMGRLLGRAQSGAGATATGAGDVIGGIFNSRSTAGPAGGGVAGQVWNYFKAKGLPDHQVAGIMGAASGESAFNPAAVGDRGSSLGLFQWRGARAAGLRAAVPDWRTNTQGQLDYAWGEMQGPESRAFGSLRNSRNALDATRAMAGFERPRGFSWKNPEAADNFTGRYSAAQDALGKYGDSITKSAGKLDSSLTTVADTTAKSAQGFSSQFPSALEKVLSGVGGGGGGSFLSSAAMALATSGKAGLFAEGGVSDRPAIFGEGGRAEAAVPLSRGRSIPVELKASPRMMREVRDSQAAPAGGRGVVIHGSTIVIEGSVDKKTLRSIHDELDRRDAKMKNDLSRGEIGAVSQKYGALKG
jgi:hypothetical protein